jgi:hypothetical protein
MMKEKNSPELTNNFKNEKAGSWPALLKIE